MPENIVIIGILLILVSIVIASGCISQQASLPSGNDGISDIPPLPDNPGPEQVQQREQTINDTAVAGDTITLVDCKPEPKALRVKEGTTIKFVNPDSIFHRIFLDSSSHKIMDKSYFEIMAKFLRGRDIYTYSCDDIESAGFLVVE